jgi:hypothetical protein
LAKVLPVAVVEAVVTRVAGLPAAPSGGDPDAQQATVLTSGAPHRTAFGITVRTTILKTPEGIEVFRHCGRQDGAVSDDAAAAAARWLPVGVAA